MVHSATVGDGLIFLLCTYHFLFYAYERKALVAAYMDIHRCVRISGLETKLDQIESFR